MVRAWDAARLLAERSRKLGLCMHKQQAKRSPVKDACVCAAAGQAAADAGLGVRGDHLAAAGRAGGTPCGRRRHINL